MTPIIRILLAQPSDGQRSYYYARFIARWGNIRRLPLGGHRTVHSDSSQDTTGHVSIPTATMVRVCISEGVPIPVDTLTSEWISPVNVASVRFGLKTVKRGVESVGAVRPFLWNQTFLWLDGFAHFEIPLTVKCQNATLCVPREVGSFSDTRQYSPRKINTHPSQINHGTQSSSPVTTPSFSLSVVLWVEMLHFMSVGTAHWC